MTDFESEEYINNIIESSLKHQWSHPDHLFEGKKLFRFLENPDHADSFSKGIIRLSTLSICRSYENREQGDKLEGTQIYNSGGPITKEQDPQLFDLVNRRSGVEVRGGYGNIVANNTAIHLIPDSYILCMTDESSTDLKNCFGNHCIEITQPHRFYALLLIAIRKQKNIPLNTITGRFGRIRYSGNHYISDQEHPGDIGFVKNANPYEWQREVRIMFSTMEPTPLNAVFLNVPELSEICIRIS